LQQDGRLDRRSLRNIVFRSDTARQDLEAILHPRIGTETKRQADAAGGEYQMIVVPLLVDSPLAKFVDRILVVDCSEATQIERLLARDAESVEQARRILAAQASREDRLALADDVIHNDGDLAELSGQVTALDARYRTICQSPHSGAK
jgi:dephospho-CoA kinase